MEAFKSTRTKFIYVRNVAAETPDFICPLCKECLINPRSSPCDHMFCHQCIVAYLQQSKGCPVCRKEISSGSLVEEATLEKKVLNTFVVRCSNFEWNCGWEGKRIDLESHLNSCEAFQCENKPNGCTWNGNLANQHSHLEICEHFLCKYSPQCKWKGPKINMPKHLHEICEFSPRPCPNIGDHCTFSGSTTIPY